MTGVALLHLGGAKAEPTEECSARFGRARSFTLLGSNEVNRIARAASIATGVVPDIHNVTDSKVLAFDPLRIRPRLALDCGVSWLWDIVAQAGGRSAVVGWPGIMEARGARVPMVSSPALALGPNDDCRWPLSSALVAPESVRADVAAVRVGCNAISDEDLPPLERANPGESDEMNQRVRETARAGLARARSAGRALETLAGGGLDFAAVAVSISINDERARSVGSVMLDTLIQSVLDSMGPDTWIITTSLRGRTGRLVLLSPPESGDEVGFDVEEFRLLDVAPTSLSLLGVPCPDHLAGWSMNGTSEEPKKAFTMPEHAGDPPSESRTLVEALEDGTLQALPKRRQETLMRFLSRRLLEEWNEARTRLDFKNGARIASLMVRFEASQANVWRLAFACQHSGDSKGAAEASQRLLESFPGSPVALLSAALLSDSSNTEELRAIVDAIDPAKIRLPSVRSTWGRTAIRAGRVEEGLAVLEKLIDKGTPLLMDRVVAASSMRSKGENARALSLLGPVGSGPTAPLNWRVLRARLLLETGHRKEACVLAQSILEAFPFESRAKQVLEECSAP